MPKSKSYFDLPPLPAEFYQGSSVQVAKRLLGKVLLSVNAKGEKVALLLTEVEAYSQKKDEASHSFRGPTPRTQAMFAEGGACYVYQCYGIHQCVNVVTGRAGVGDAVLLRGGLPIAGETIVQKRRGIRVKTRDLCNGPGRLTQALQIESRHNGELFNTRTLKIVDGGFVVPRSQIIATPRIGISKAKDLPWRFVWEVPASSNL